MIHHDFLPALLIILREGHDAIFPAESLNAAGSRRRIALAVIVDASSSAAAAHADETAIFGISGGVALGEAVAVVVESLTGVGAHGNGDDGNQRCDVSNVPRAKQIENRSARRFWCAQSTY